MPVDGEDEGEPGVIADEVSEGFPLLASREHIVAPRMEFFPSDREGTDRWGRDRATLRLCGTPEARCAAGVEESCPGDGNSGTRLEPARTRKCALDCASCGGGGRVATFTRCGWDRGQPMWEQAIAEVGGSLRLDKWTCTPPLTRAAPWPANYVPVVEGYAQHWPAVQSLPMLGTTMQTSMPPKRNMNEARTIRDRLGGCGCGEPGHPPAGAYNGTLIVNGLVKDDMLDDVWDDRSRFIEYALLSRVDVMVVHQFSYYDFDHSCAHIYNANRSFYLYHQFREAGFPLVVMDMPPHHRDWFQDEYLDFCDRSEVAAVAISLQTFGFRGSLHPLHIKGLRHIHARLDPTVAVMVFGIGTLIGMTQITKLFPGRNLVFSGKEPYGQTIFFQLMKTGASAPPGMDKPTVFAHNLAWAQLMADKIKERSGS